jgi:hypothetical protein
MKGQLESHYNQVRTKDNITTGCTSYEYLLSRSCLMVKCVNWVSSMVSWVGNRHLHQNPQVLQKMVWASLVSTIDLLHHQLNWYGIETYLKCWIPPLNFLSPNLTLTNLVMKYIIYSLRTNYFHSIYLLKEDEELCVMLGSVMVRYEHFGGHYCVHLQSELTSRKTMIWIFTTEKISNHARRKVSVEVHRPLIK